MITLPWMKLPTDGGSDTVIVVFVRVLKLSSRTLEPVPVPLGGCGHQPEVAADREHGPVRKLKVAADVEQVQVAADEDARSGAAQVGAR